MFHVKICGVTSVADAVAVAQAGADAVGLNFCASSPRRIDLPTARAISAQLPAGIARVGVFVNSLPADVRRIAREATLDYVQLHGDETPEYLTELAALRVIRAFRGNEDFQRVAGFLEDCRRLEKLPAAILVDAFQAGQYGGTGQQPDWSAIVAARPSWGDLPLILAGGLRPDNVPAAIAAVHPTAVDTASGVESEPGRKSAQRVAEFVVAARTAFGLPGAAGV